MTAAAASVTQITRAPVRLPHLHLDMLLEIPRELLSIGIHWSRIQLERHHLEVWEVALPQEVRHGAAEGRNDAAGQPLVVDKTCQVAKASIIKSGACLSHELVAGDQPGTQVSAVAAIGSEESHDTVRPLHFHAHSLARMVNGLKQVLQPTLRPPPLSLQGLQQELVFNGPDWSDNG